MLTIRPARSEDYATYARLFVELATDDPIPTFERFDTITRPTTLICERGSVAAGYAFYEILGDLCYVRNLVSDPTARRAGIGSALLQQIARIARLSGCSRWCLNVKPENEPAVTLYEKLGFLPVNEGRSLRVSWDLVSRLPSGPTATPLEPDEDDEAQRAFDLEPGLLSNRRAKGSVVLGLVREGALRAVAAFDPSFPGGYPFRAASIEDAGSLLRAMRDRRARIDDAGSWRERGVQLFVERPPSLIDALLGLGAEPILRILHMRALLPKT